jgi:uncharacterized protein YegJ (DUF2314 family)
MRCFRFLVTVAAIWSNTVVAQQRDESEVLLVGTTDPQMVAAIREARATLDGFLALAASPPAGTENFKLKVMVKDGSNTEHFWVTPFRPTAEGFEGILANDPRIVRNVKAGQTIRFAKAEISDWGYVRAGRQVGSFTVCVLFKKMPADQADYYRKNHGFDC